MRVPPSLRPLKLTIPDVHSLPVVSGKGAAGTWLALGLAEQDGAGKSSMQLAVARTPRFSVLIADGDQTFRELVKRHLGQAALVIGDASDGNEAVWLASRLHPDVVLMDIAMPLLAGPEAARQIKAARAETKVVLLTSGDEAKDLDWAGSAGPTGLSLVADALLPKRNVISGILSQLGRIEAAEAAHRRPVSSGRREIVSSHARGRRSRR
jgi:CheY-like chemotaxis protein